MFKEGQGKRKQESSRAVQSNVCPIRLRRISFPLAGQVQDMVIVTNEEVDRDGICYEPETMEYIRLMGCLNQKLASAADRVVEVVYGIPVLLKPSALGPGSSGLTLKEGSVRENEQTLFLHHSNFHVFQDTYAQRGVE